MLQAEICRSRRFLKGVGHFKPKFYIEGLSFCAPIYGPLDRGMTVLPLCWWKFSHKETLQQTLFD